MKIKKVFILIGILLFWASFAYATEELFFFCGSAVAVPMREIINNYEQEKGIKVNAIYGGSGTLLSQMELTKKGDVYLCGSPDYINIGVRRKLLIEETDKIVSYLIPAIIVPKENPKNIQKLGDLAKKDIRVGIGNPETVCLGLYTVELLEYNNLLEKVLPNVVVFAKSCEDTATLSVLKTVDAIIGWDVFESWNPREVKWIKIDEKQIPRISTIPIAIPVFVNNRKLSEDFINYVLSSEKGGKIFKKWGYISDVNKANKYAPEAKIGGEYKLPEKYFQLIRK
ncbi:MAG: molybdate ABC transporter substrate-binding protein [Candidatus Atribacteria bacterium]|nr:molybdate ABC transporter substrate-binding protein [Candidatus Atribacteria bacterium]